MSDDSPALERSVLVPDHPSAVALLVQPLLADLVGPDAAPVSLGYEFGAGLAAGESVVLSARIIRGTRTLVFAQASVIKESGLLAADISAVFRRLNVQEQAKDRAG